MPRVHSCHSRSGRSLGELLERRLLDLTDSFRAHPEKLRDLPQRLWSPSDTEAGADDHSLALAQVPGERAPGEIPLLQPQTGPAPGQAIKPIVMNFGTGTRRIEVQGY